MRHLLNFDPPVKFRKGSSFMFHAKVCLLYFLPLMLGSFLLIEYIELDALITRTSEALERLETRHAKFARALAGARGEMGDLKADEERLRRYYRALAGLSFSWTGLLGTLEEIVPAGVRLVRVRIRPESVVKMFIEGQATELGQVTELLRRFHGRPRFVEPRLSRHSREETSEGTMIRFSLDVDYLPTLEVRP